MSGNPRRLGSPEEDSARTEPALLAIRRCLQGRLDVRLALVFGSRARGTATATSDIDVAVAAPDVDLLDLGALLSKATGLDVDVVDLAHAGVPLLARIIREAVLVHEARPGTAATWRAHALADLETDLPWFTRMQEAWLTRVAAHGP